MPHKLKILKCFILQSAHQDIKNVLINFVSFEIREICVGQGQWISGFSWMCFVLNKLNVCHFAMEIFGTRFS